VAVRPGAFGKGVIFIDQLGCVNCWCCVCACPVSAILLVDKSIGLEPVNYSAVR
jgi:Fe-S-cluster-containing hydrogenase component 2